MSTHERFFAARLTGTGLFDPLGDRIGKVRDVVLVPQETQTARAVGLVVEVPGKKRIFLPITKVTSISTGQVISDGSLNMRRFEMRKSEILAVGDLLDRKVGLVDGTGEAFVEDVALEQDQISQEWEITKLYVRRSKAKNALSKLVGRNETFTVGIDDVRGLFGTQAEQSAQILLASYSDLKPADLADLIQEMEPKRRADIVRDLSNERLGWVLEELPEDTRVELMQGLESERAADILDAMDPDDAADLLQELPEPMGQDLLTRMEPEEAEDVRRLLAYDEYTAGGLMTTEPLIVAPETPVAHCLALISREEISPALASMVYVCRQPLETPTGKLLGGVHFQHLLRERPERPVGEIIDQDQVTMAPTSHLHDVTREMATYNLVSLPVVDQDSRLLGSVTVDDVLDHVLPEDWRESDEPVATTTGQIDLTGIAKAISDQEG